MEAVGAETYPHSSSVTSSTTSVSRAHTSTSEIARPCDTVSAAPPAASPVAAGSVTGGAAAAKRLRKMGASAADPVPAAMLPLALARRTNSRQWCSDARRAALALMLASPRLVTASAAFALSAAAPSEPTPVPGGSSASLAPPVVLYALGLPATAPSAAADAHKEPSYDHTNPCGAAARFSVSVATTMEATGGDADGPSAALLAKDPVNLRGETTGAPDSRCRSARLHTRFK